MKLIRHATLAFAALVSVTTAAKANEWKMSPLGQQATIIPGARELQDADRREFLCMALNVYHEARGESRIGQQAVAHVVLNRRKSGRYPTTLCAVIWQRSQFSWTIRPVGSLVPRESASWERSQLVALEAVTGKSADTSAGAMYFSPRRGWKPRIRIGAHTFY